MVWPPMTISLTPSERSTATSPSPAATATVASGTGGAVSSDTSVSAGPCACRASRSSTCRSMSSIWMSASRPLSDQRTEHLAGVFRVAMDPYDLAVTDDHGPVG